MSSKDLERHTIANLDVRNSILDAIKENLENEKLVNIGEIGNLAGAVARLAARDLYGKGPPDNNYSKNTQRQAFDQADLIRTIGDVQGLLKR